MNTGPYEILAPLIGLAVNAGIQIGLSRFAGMRLLKTVFAGFFLGLFPVLAQGLCSQAGPGIISANCMIYFCLAYCYFHFINMGETARRIRIIQEIHSSGTGLTRDEILARYNAEEILEKRLARLLNNGQVRLENGKYYLKPSLMLLITRIFIFTRSLILGRNPRDRDFNENTP